MVCSTSRPGALRTTITETLSLPPAASAASTSRSAAISGSALGQDRGDRGLIDHPGQAVAAQQEQIVRLKPAIDDVEMQLRDRRRSRA